MAYEQQSVHPAAADEQDRLFPLTWQRVGAASGIVFVVLLLVTLSVSAGDFPDFDEAPQRYASFAAENADDIQVGALLQVFAGVAFLWFLGHLRTALDRWAGAGAGKSRLASIAFAGGLLGITFAWAGVATEVAAVSQTGGTEPSVIRALMHLSGMLFYFSSAALAVMLLAASLVILRTRLLPVWLAYVGILAAVLLLVGQFNLLDPAEEGIGFLGFPGFLLFLVWVLGTSIALVRRVGTTRAGVPPPSGATTTPA